MRESDVSPAAKLLFAFATLTANRSGEARLARWTEVDLEKRVWTVPAERMKAKREHRVPLATQTIQVLAVDSGRTLPVIPANVTTESGQPYQRFRGKPSNFGWLPEWVVGMTGMDRRASASLIEQASGSHSSGEGEAMANERISMRKIRDIIRLREKGLGYRQIGRALRISHPVVSQYARDFTATGLSYAQIKGISDSELMELLAGGRTADARYGALGAWFERCARELKRVGVTIQQIWEEYRQEQPDGYSYSQFCYHFQVWRDGDEVTMHIEHKVGDKLFVDFAGKKLTVSERHGGGRREVESFVAVLGASQLGYLEAVETQQKADLIAASGGALDYIGGVPAAIVPDCLKSAVTKADPYEPDLNRAYAAFARHYGMVVLPAPQPQAQGQSVGRANGTPDVSASVRQAARSHVLQHR